MSDTFSIIKDSDIPLMLECDDYEKFVKELNQAGFHATCLGLAGESGELLDLIKKRDHHGVNVSKEQIIDEAGDVLFYLVGLLVSEGASLSQVISWNTEKLRARYPDGFKAGGGIRKK